jgi:hypothetical protein
MNFETIKEIVSKFAPLLGSVITEANPIAGLIIMAIAKLFGASSDPSDIANKIANDPDAEVKLKKLELDHSLALQQNQNEDKNSARLREENIVKITGKRDWIMDFISSVVVIGFVCLCIYSIVTDYSRNSLSGILIGHFSSAFMLCLSYYFGSSNK